MTCRIGDSVFVQKLLLLLFEHHASKNKNNIGNIFLVFMVGKLYIKQIADVELPHQPGYKNLKDKLRNCFWH